MRRTYFQRPMNALTLWLGATNLGDQSGQRKRSITLSPVMAGS